MVKASFQGRNYSVIFTDHAKLRMSLRNLEEAVVINVIETGEVRPKTTEGKFWVFKKVPGRKDNLISISISIEAPNLIVITTLVNWRPQ